LPDGFDSQHNEQRDPKTSPYVGEAPDDKLTELVLSTPGENDYTIFG